MIIINVMCLIIMNCKNRDSIKITLLLTAFLNILYRHGRSKTVQNLRNPTRTLRTTLLDSRTPLHTRFIRVFRPLSTDPGFTTPRSLHPRHLLQLRPWTTTTPVRCLATIKRPTSLLCPVLASNSIPRLLTGC